MPKHTPAPDEQAAIDLLHARGYEVLRARSAAALRERVRVAEALRDCEIEHRESTTRWAHTAFDEQRRLSDRCNELVEFALRHGATIEDLAAFNDEMARRRAGAARTETARTEAASTETAGA